MNKLVTLVLACFMPLSRRQAPEKSQQTESTVQVVSSQNRLPRYRNDDYLDDLIGTRYLLEMKYAEALTHYCK